MSRKVAILPINNDAIHLMISTLPVNISVTSKVELFDKAVSFVKLEGDGLPDWCAEPPDGGDFVRVAIGHTTEGLWYFVPQPSSIAHSHDDDNHYERFINQFVTNN